jgi:2-polyprenyl-6-hydroxyphenyl methylase/3-demethylubiquinone-9 3-methyltransferase
MKLGPCVRRLFGPLEPRIADAYRSIYVDIDALVGLIARWQPAAARILEVGCGEGAVTQRLCAAYPAASITAIDVTPRVGRLFRGRAERVQFLRTTVQEISRREAASYDLVVLSDVLHHVPPQQRRGLLDAVRLCMAPQGVFVCKDWQRNLSPIHWLCYASDRWLTGDRISYMSHDEMRDGLAACFGPETLRCEARVRPWSNNLAFRVAPSEQIQADAGHADRDQHHPEKIAERLYGERGVHPP